MVLCLLSMMPAGGLVLNYFFTQTREHELHQHSRDNWFGDQIWSMTLLGQDMFKI